MPTPVPIPPAGQRLRVAVHKLSSCDGCQLAFLNLGEDLLRIASVVDIVHFAEAGPVDPEAEVDVAFIEGSAAHPGDMQRLEGIRERSRFLVTIGACATAGGIQALRNAADAPAWLADVYPSPAAIEELEDSTPVSDHVRVDFQLWGCPVTGRQVLATLGSLLAGVRPADTADKVCLECKRRQNPCVMVTRGLPCLGPVTRTGCGALCPAFGRDCYGCFGPAELPNTGALARRFQGLGLVPEAVVRKFAGINNAAPAFTEAARLVLGEHGDG